MNDTSPPGYSAASTPSAVLVNLAPPAESTTFQLGHLGYGPAFVAGDVQVKFAGAETDTRPAFSRLEVAFRGVERSGQEKIELCEQTKVLWGVGAAGSSAEASSYEEGGAFPPGSSPFKLELTSDLPTCLHLAGSSLEYTLTATLFYADSSLPPLVRCSPVHLARTSPPGSLLAGNNLAALSDCPPSTTPQNFSASSPIPFSIRLSRTVFRRSEPVELVTRIEVPDAKVVGEGLRLRTVSAELVRTIKVAGGDEQVVHRTVLAHSGKSARFSATRPIVIKLVLHPPAELSCESITQSTILHSVSFSVRVIVGLFNNSAPASSSTSLSAPCALDASLSREIFIVPDLSSARSEKQREVDREAASPSTSPAADAWIPHDGPVPTYVEDSQDDPGLSAPVASGSGGAVLNAAEQEQLRRNFSSSPAFEETEDEFDGYYEDLSFPSLHSSRPPPPPIDDDVSPPSATDSAGSLSLEVATAQGLAHPLEEDERDEPLEPYEPPPPNDFSPLGDPEVEHNTSPPPLFQPHEHTPPPLHQTAQLEPATPPPPIDFTPLPSLASHQPSAPRSALHPAPSPPSSPPPPVSPLDAPGDYPSQAERHHQRELSTQSGYPHAPPGPDQPLRTASEEGLPPPYFGAPAYHAVPDSQSRASSVDRWSECSSADGTTSDGGYGQRTSAPASAGSSRPGSDGGAEAEQEQGEEDEPRPPPYESQDAHERAELVRFGVNRQGELVL
ncbi:hypothetical protein JCM10213_008835 [Rhodosporidiobolus nylandii]